MAPVVPTFNVSELPTQINTDAKGKPLKSPRKLEDGVPKQIVQYKCGIMPPSAEEKKQGLKPTILCEPVMRRFRQFADGMTVETTAWESIRAEEKAR